MEMFRVLTRGGRAILSTPFVPTWQRTFDDIVIIDKKARDLFFGQGDHLRYYGSDFVGLLRGAGFDVAEDVANEPDVSRFGLVRGHVIFVATKPEFH